jgi:hypothetical protein
MQALHPLAMAGVDQHSSWRRDPVARLAVTMAYLPAFTFGDLAAAIRASAWVRRIQDHVRGTDAVTGCPYAAGDRALLLWGARSAGRFGPGRRNRGRDRGRITSQRIRALGRRVVMTCSFSLQPDM